MQLLAHRLNSQLHPVRHSCLVSLKARRSTVLEPLPVLLQRPTHSSGVPGPGDTLHVLPVNAASHNSAIRLTCVAYFGSLARTVCANLRLAPRTLAGRGQTITLHTMFIPVTRYTESNVAACPRNANLASIPPQGTSQPSHWWYL